MSTSTVNDPAAPRESGAGAKRMTTFKLFVPRKTAVLYYSWEIGNRPAAVAKKINSLPRDARGWLEVSADTLFRPVKAKRWTRRQLEGFASRIREAVAYQEGRLGKPLTAGGGCVHVAPPHKHQPGGE